MKERIEKYRAENPKITEQFADLKRQLAEVSDGAWGVHTCLPFAPVNWAVCTLTAHPHTLTITLASTAICIESQVKAEEWEAIPDIGDYTIKRQKRETFAPAPDSLLAAAANASGATGGTNTLDAGLDTPAGSGSSVSNLTDMGAWGCFAFASKHFWPCYCL